MEQTAEVSVAEFEAQRALKELDRRNKALAVLHGSTARQRWLYPLLCSFGGAVTSVLVGRLLRGSGLPDSVESLLVGLSVGLVAAAIVMHSQTRRLDAVVELMKLDEKAKEHR